jgi:hypothetical protein
LNPHAKGLRSARAQRKTPEACECNDHDDYWIRDDDADVRQDIG